MITILLITLNVAAFVALKAAGFVDASWPDVCVAYGGMQGDCPGALADHPWSIVSYQFIHINVLHLTVNMLWLLAFGTMLEKTAGRGALLSAFAVGAVAGAVGFAIAAPGDGYLIGSSAAVLAVAFAALCSGAPARIEMPGRMRRWLTPAAWVAAGLLLLSQSDAIPAHLAGMLTGILLGIIFAAQRHRREQTARQHAMRLSRRDSLLLKANTLGFSSLSAAERQTLFELSDSVHDNNTESATTIAQRQ